MALSRTSTPVCHMGDTGEGANGHRSIRYPRPRRRREGVMSQHWNDVYETKAADQLSWTEDSPATSLELLDLLGVTPSASLIDVGAGTSHLVDALSARGFRDLSILDVSAAALAATLARPGLSAAAAIEADVTTWQPTRRYDVWHDRAVLHFVDPTRAELYAAALRAALAADAKVVIGVFAPDGPDSCSGLAVTRYDAADLARLLGEEFVVVQERRTHHLTPWGTDQSFQWIAARRVGRAS